MYVNPLYPVEDLDTVHGWLEERPFGTLVAPGPPLAVGHVPFVLDRGMGPSGGFRAHTPIRDPISEVLATGAEVLAVFLGPLAYVSPDWYGEPAFGTYNFVAIHATCVPTPIVDEREVRDHLRELTDRHQARIHGTPAAWEPTLAARYDGLRPHIAPFRLRIVHLEAKAKLGQHRSAEDRRGVIAGLRATQADDGACALADLMEAFSYASDDAQPLIGGDGPR